MQDKTTFVKREPIIKGKYLTCQNMSEKLSLKIRKLSLPINPHICSTHYYCMCVNVCVCICVYVVEYTIFNEFFFILFSIFLKVDSTCLMCAPSDFLDFRKPIDRVNVEGNHFIPFLPLSLFIFDIFNLIEVGFVIKIELHFFQLSPF